MSDESAGLKCIDRKEEALHVLGPTDNPSYVESQPATLPKPIKYCTNLGSAGMLTSLVIHDRELEKVTQRQI